MNEKCKSCPKREDCSDISPDDGLVEVGINEQNTMLNLLLQFEQSICRTIDFTLNGRNAGLQWIFFKIMSNKMGAIAKEIESHLVGSPDGDANIDWDAITSIGELSDEYQDSQKEESDDEWFKGDIKGV